MHKSIFLVALTLFTAACQKAPDFPSVTLKGLGPVKLGMSISEAEKALGTMLSSRDEGFDEQCWYSFAKDDSDPITSYILNGTKIVRIDVLNPNGLGVHIKTDSGFGIGSSEDEIRKYYGTALERKKHPYIGNDGSYLKVSSLETQSVLLFETDNGVVTSLRIGFEPHVDYIEGCA
jgi:hypothetical protein